MDRSAADAATWGVDQRYQRADGRWWDAPRSTVEAVLDAMGAGAEGPPAPGALIVRQGDGAAVAGPVTVALEDGGEVAVGDRLPPDLPLGYHELRFPDRPPQVLVVSPGRCALPGHARAWGWAAQLYGVRSDGSWGIGDLGDLGELCRWSGAELGAEFALVNPLHAGLPGLPQENSPYFPSSRRYRNPLYLRVEQVDGAAVLGADLDRLAAAGRALNHQRCIDRDEVWRLKSEALERLWAATRPGPAFEAWRAAEGEGLDDYATFCALAEEHGRPWTAWPASLRHPRAGGVVEFRRAHRDRVDHHAWLQWLLHLQLKDAEAALPVIQDIAIGFDPAGADAWAFQDLLLTDLSVGAPPDEFNTLGQDWGAPPFDPWRLRAAGYRPFVDSLRAVLRPGGGVRIDHVMGLFRLFCIPRGQGPSTGTYVRYPAGDLLDLVALESHRSGAYVVGEDLGTVEEHVRDELHDRAVLSYRLLWFDFDTEGWPEQALGAVTTHDLPTIAGLWSGTDLEAQHQAGVEPNVEAEEAVRAQLRDLCRLGPEPTIDEVVAATHAHLGRARSRLLVATLDDALGVEERPNMPGTTDQWPNWRLALPHSLDDIRSHPGTRRVAEALRRPPGDGTEPAAAGDRPTPEGDGRW